MQTILITGGTGLVGRRLTQMLTDKGYNVLILSRTAKQSQQVNVSYAIWDIDKQTIDKDAIAKATGIIHLAGAGVADKRWSDSRKKEIVESRTKSSELIVKALKEIPNNVTIVVSSSAIGWYGADTQESIAKGFTEDEPADEEFLGKTCRLWEESIEPVTQQGKRLVKLRTGIVLSKEGGALAEFKKPIKFGIASILGSGKQMISWIHIDDLCRMYIKALEDNAMQGAYNAVAPQPTSNKDFILLLANKMRGKFYISMHVPTFVLKIMLGEMSVEVLKSATVSCKKIKDDGFNFLYPTLNTAIEASL